MKRLALTLTLLFTLVGIAVSQPKIDQQPTRGLVVYVAWCARLMPAKEFKVRHTAKIEIQDDQGRLGKYEIDLESRLFRGVLLGSKPAKLKDVVVGSQVNLTLDKQSVIGVIILTEPPNGKDK